MGPFALLAHQAEELDRPRTRRTKPVRRAGVELGNLSGHEDEVVLSEDEAESSVEHERPVVTLVGTQVRLGVVSTFRQDELVGLDASGSARQRDDRASVAGQDRSQVDARVAGRRCVHEFVQRHPVGAREWQKLFERRSSKPRLQPRQRADRYAGLLGEVGQGDVSALAQLLQP